MNKQLVFIILSPFIAIGVNLIVRIIFFAYYIPKHPEETDPYYTAQQIENSRFDRKTRIIIILISLCVFWSFYFLWINYQ